MIKELTMRLYPRILLVAACVGVLTVAAGCAFETPTEEDLAAEAAELEAAAAESAATAQAAGAPGNYSICVANCQRLLADNLSACAPWPLGGTCRANAQAAYSNCKGSCSRAHISSRPLTTGN